MPFGPFETKARRELVKWLDAPFETPPPVVSRKASEVQITWRDVAHRLDDKTFTNEETTQTAELSCEKKPTAILIPWKIAAQKSYERKVQESISNK